MSLQQFERKSLQEINQSIDVPKGIPFWKTLLLFSGPGSLVAVGYMDPGNWITSVVGGAQYLSLIHILQYHKTDLSPSDQNPSAHQCGSIRDPNSYQVSGG